MIFTASITEVVTPNIGWDGDGHRIVDVGAGTERRSVIGVVEDFMKSSCKSPDMFPGITSMCEDNAIHISVINCETTIIVVRTECIYSLLLVANDLTTHVCVSYAMKVKGCRGASSSINVHCTESLWSSQQFQSFRACVAAVGHVDFGHSHPASCDPPTGPAHVTVHVMRGVACTPEPVVVRGSSGAELLDLPAGGGRVAGGATRNTHEVELGHDVRLPFNHSGKLPHSFLQSIAGARIVSVEVQRTRTLVPR